MPDETHGGRRGVTKVAVAYGHVRGVRVVIPQENVVAAVNKVKSADAPAPDACGPENVRARVCLLDDSSAFATQVCRCAGTRRRHLALVALWDQGP